MRFTSYRLWAAFLAVAVLSACTTTRPAKVAEQERERLHQARIDRLAEFDGWAIDGRLAVSNEKDGGSGRFFWENKTAGSRMEFHGALGRGAWTLEADEKGAVLILADGAIHRAGSVDQLVRSQVGWQIPVESMSWWVRGLARPGNPRQRVIDGEGNITELKQEGWTVVFEKFREYEGVSLPVKLKAQKGQWKVKLVIRSWDLTDQSPHD